MNVCCEFLSLTVPGLAEGRPSLLLGDKIVASLTGMVHLNAVHVQYILIFFFIEELFFNHVKMINISFCARHCCPYFYPNWISGSKTFFWIKKNRSCICYFPRWETALSFYTVWVNVLVRKSFEPTFHSHFRFTLLWPIVFNKGKKKMRINNQMNCG